MPTQTPPNKNRRPNLTFALTVAGLAILLSACAFDPATRNGTQDVHPMTDFRVSSPPSL